MTPCLSCIFVRVFSSVKMAATSAVPSSYLDAVSPEELTSRSEHLAYECGKVMERIGKMKMWEHWLDEEDLYDEGADREGFWEDKSKEAWAAEATASLDEEGRAEYAKRLVDIRKKWVALTYEAKCASVMYWDQEAEGEEFCADALLYWQEKVDRLEWIIAARKKAAAAKAAATGEAKTE